MALSEGGPEPWWGEPYHAIQNWGSEVLWGSGGFPENVPPLCLLLDLYTLELKWHQMQSIFVQFAGEPFKDNFTTYT